MAHKFTEEQLNSADRALLIQMILNLQDQSEALTKEVSPRPERKDAADDGTARPCKERPFWAVL